MKAGHATRAATLFKAALLILVLLLPAARPLGATEQPLSKDDVMLLIIGGAASEKIINFIEQRGVNFRMDADLAKKFHDSGAGDEVIEALQRAGEKAQIAAPAAPAAPADARPAKGVALVDPSPNQVEQIIREFAVKEKLFKGARNNYTYHQLNKVQELGPDSEVIGVYEQEWDILYDDSGNRIERVTYAPVDSLQRIGVTPEDLNAMRNIQPFVLTSDELPEYDVKYLGHVKVDEITAYVFSIRPKEIKKGRQYFQGRVWVDDRDLQIVKSEGKSVPEMKTKKGENLFPRFTTYREQIDGKYWFPTFTMADDTLYFSSGPVHVKQVIKYSDYKQFKASSTVKIVTELPSSTPERPPKPSSPK